MKCAVANKSTASRRRGITIIEVMIVVSVVSALLGICAVSIQILMRLNTDVLARYNAGVAVERLGRQIRDDAHASQNATLVAPAPEPAKRHGLRLEFASNRTVRYEVGDGIVIRTDAHANKVIGHETFTLPRGKVAKFELRNEGTRQLAALVMTRVPGKSQTDPPRPLEVIAVLGKDRAHSSDKQRGKPQ